MWTKTLPVSWSTVGEAQPTRLLGMSVWATGKSSRQSSPPVAMSQQTVDCRACGNSSVFRTSSSVRVLRYARPSKIAGVARPPVSLTQSRFFAPSAVPFSPRDQSSISPVSRETPVPSGPRQ